MKRTLPIEILLCLLLIPILPAGATEQLAREVARDPSLQFILNETDSGRRLKEAIAKRFKGRSLEEYIKSLPGDSTLAKRLRQLKGSHAYYGKSEKLPAEIPLSDWDKVTLRHLAQDFLDTGEFQKDGQWKGVKEPPAPRMPKRFEYLDPKIRAASRHFEQVLDWAENADESVPPETIYKKMDEATEALLKKLGVHYRTVELEGGFKGFQLRGEGEHALNKIAAGTFEHLDKTRLVISPSKSMADGIRGVFNPNTNSIIIPNAVLLEGRAEETTLHELIHAWIAHHTKLKPASPLEGDIITKMPAGLTSRFGYANHYLSPEEIATYSMGLKRVSERLEFYETYSPKEKQWVFELLQKNARYGEMASGYGADVMSAAIKALHKNPNRYKVYSDPNGPKGQLQMYVNFTHPETRQKISLHLPVNLSPDEVKAGFDPRKNSELGKALVREITRRRDEYTRVAGQFGEVSRLIYSPKLKPEQLKEIIAKSDVPREATQTLLGAAALKPCLHQGFNRFLK